MKHTLTLQSRWHASAIPGNEASFFQPFQHVIFRSEQVCFVFCTDDTIAKLDMFVWVMNEC